MTTEHFYPEGSDLSSRTTARKLREKIEESISAGNHAVIDLNRVICICHSYADELFAVLVDRHVSLALINATIATKNQ